MRQKTIIVTGASKQGIGEAVTRKLIEKGMYVIGTYQDEYETEAQNLKKDLNTDFLELHKVDFANKNDVIKFCKYVVSKYRIDGIVNAEFYFEIENQYNFDYDIWDKSIQVNLSSPNILVRELLISMNKGSSIVFITSTEGFVGSFGASSYSATKAAIHNLVKTFANNLGKLNIRINAIAAGWIGGVMDTDEIFNMSRNLTPLNRLGNPVEIADTVSFLLSDKAGFINGTTVVADGGYTGVDPIAKYEFEETQNYYDYLLTYMKYLEKGSRIWAISTMLDTEWDETENEKEFLKLNIELPRKGIDIERIFIVSKKIRKKISSNKSILMHDEFASKNLKAFVIEREILEKQNKALLEEIGYGFIAFDNDLLLLDSDDTNSTRGKIVKDMKDIARYKKAYNKLKKYAIGLQEYKDNITLNLK